jgi:UDP-glucose 4-epimerase
VVDPQKMETLKTTIKTILVAGGAGYIGSHAVVSLLLHGYKVIILDNLSNSNVDVLNNIQRITDKKPIFVEGDVLDSTILEFIFTTYSIDYVFHFANLKVVGESLKIPLTYYHTNITGTVNLLTVMGKHNCKKFIFSSSATVYGEQKEYSIRETALTGQGITNPYGKSKYMMEEILKDLYASDNTWTIIILRYFNPIGSHPSGLLNETPKGIPNNLFPCIMRVAKGFCSELQVFGNNYWTKDGTCLRDYIHVEDLIDGHLASMKKLLNPGIYIYNLGYGRGISVFDLIFAYERVNGVKIPFTVVGRRDGDQPSVFANVDKAFIELGWACKKNLDEMCKVY